MRQHCFAEGRNRGPVSAGADEDLEDVLGIDLSVLTEFDIKRLGEDIDEEIKKLVFVYLIVCSRGRRHIFSKQTSQLTGFVMY